MELQEFVELLQATRPEMAWRINMAGILRGTLGENDPRVLGDFCPITAVAYAYSGKYFPLHKWKLACLECHISQEDASIIMDTSDNVAWIDGRYSHEMRAILIASTVSFLEKQSL